MVTKRRQPVHHEERELPKGHADEVMAQLRPPVPSDYRRIAMYRLIATQSEATACYTDVED
ncbi:MAG: hypothetical protein NTZ38_02420 [Candidatus Taylorbacteria bacterium]|nr:hypothetical protein [Candidatus Taylorbacteria bacterium]